MRTVRAGPRRARRGGSSRPRRRPLIYGLGNQQKRAKARRENCLFNLFTFDIQPPPQGLILASSLSYPPFPRPRAPCAPRAPFLRQRAAFAPPRPGDHVSQPCAGTRGGPDPCSGGRRLLGEVHSARPHLRGRREGGEARISIRRTRSRSRYLFSDPRSFPYFCDWSSTPLRPDGVGWELHFPRREAPVSLEAEKALGLDVLEGGLLP